MQFFNHPEGYVTPNNTGGFDYIYQYKDHTSSVRLSYSDVNGDGEITQNEILQEKNYYPGGGIHKGYNNVTTSNGNSIAGKYGYGSREFSEELGIETYDFGARGYDPWKLRWDNVDAFAEFMRGQSPYNYAFNNPIYFSDYAGHIPWPIPLFYKIWKRKSRPDSGYGIRKRRGKTKLHAGGDYNYSGGGNTDLGAPIVATHSGRVARITPLAAGNAGGRIVVIESPDGDFETKYMHLSAIVVQAGDEISEGQTIGLMGGSAYGKELGETVHLHYEIHKDLGFGKRSINTWQNGAPVDPQKWVSPTGPETEAQSNSRSSVFTMFITLTTDGTEDTSTTTETREAVSTASSVTPAGVTPVSPTPVVPIHPLQPGTPKPFIPEIIIPNTPPTLD